jgi:hypothetical protein
MSARGRRSHPNLRRTVAPLPGRARGGAKVVARRTRDEPLLAPLTQTEMDAGLMTDREASPARSPRFFSEVRQLEELERILNVKSRRFRLQFFAVAGDHGPAIVAEADIEAADAADAIRAAADAPLPPRAIGVRVLDREGCEIFEQLKADRR